MDIEHLTITYLSFHFIKIWLLIGASQFLINIFLQISGITGYASNNSRALQRRRSSVSEYVKSQDEEDDTSTRVVRHPSKRRLRKHVLRQESYEDRSPLYYFNHSDVLRDSGVCCSNAHVHARRAASLDQYLDMNCPDHHKDVV